jgi:hypothetical protein
MISNPRCEVPVSSATVHFGKSCDYIYEDGQSALSTHFMKMFKNSIDKIRVAILLDGVQKV